MCELRFQAVESESNGCCCDCGTDVRCRVPDKKAPVEEHSHTKLDDARSNVSVTTISPQHGQGGQMQISKAKPVACHSRVNIAGFERFERKASFAGLLAKRVGE